MDWVALVIPLFLFLGLLTVGVPIGFTLGICSFVGYSMVAGFDAGLTRLGSICVSAMGNFAFAAIPLFILMGEFIVVSGMGSKLYEVAWRWVGRLPGGLAVATVLACSVVAAMTGTSTAGCVAIGVVAVTVHLAPGRRGAEEEHNRAACVGAQALDVIDVAGQRRHRLGAGQAPVGFVVLIRAQITGGQDVDRNQGEDHRAEAHDQASRREPDCSEPVFTSAVAGSPHALARHEIDRSRAQTLVSS